MNVTRVGSVLVRAARRRRVRPRRGRATRAARARRRRRSARRRAPCRAPRDRACAPGGAHTDDLVGDEAELGHLLQLAGAVRRARGSVEPGALARAEAVAELLEVAGQEAGRVAVALAGLVGELLRLGAGALAPTATSASSSSRCIRRQARGPPRRRTPSAARCARARAARGRGAGSGPRRRC